MLAGSAGLQQQASGGGQQMQVSGGMAPMAPMGSMAPMRPMSFGSGALFTPDPSSSGAQNEARYACFPASGRLAVEVNGHVSVYDTSGHQIAGISSQHQPRAPLGGGRGGGGFRGRAGGSRSCQTRTHRRRASLRRVRHP